MRSPFAGPFASPSLAFVAICAFAATCALGSTARADWTADPLVHVLLRDDAPGRARDLVQPLADAGGHVAVVLTDRTALVHAGPAALADARVSSWIRRTDAETIDRDAFATAVGTASDVRAGTTFDAARSAAVWNELLAMRVARHDESGGAAQGWLPDARHVPVTLPEMPQRRDAPTHIPYGAQYYDTSTFLAGSSAVGVWLLESTGAAYDWTLAEENQTIAGVTSGLAWWVTHGGVMANLTFVLDVHTGAPVSGEPILNPQSWEAIWIDEALTDAGWAGADAFEKCFAYNNAIRDAYQTNWAFSYFIVDSDPAVNQGLFSTGGYAWAYYGGPWIWMSRYSSWAYNAANYYEAVPEHEMGHTFYATDEYDGSQQLSGYMNWNDNASTSVICLMNQNVHNRICTPSQRQVGWHDLDANGIMAPLDVAPDAQLDPALPDPTSNPTPTWTGRADVNTLDNLNPNDWRYSPPHDVTVATIDAVECRVDAGAWSAATPTDGAFDAYGEDFSWTSPPLADGVHVVEARAHTTAGVWTTVLGSDTITISGSPVGAPVVAASAEFLRVLPNPSHGDVAFAWSARSGPVELAVFDAAGRTVFAGSRAEAEGRIRWDRRDGQGNPVAAGVYMVRLRAAGVEKSQRLVILR